MTDLEKDIISTGLSQDHEENDSKESDLMGIQDKSVTNADVADGIAENNADAIAEAELPPEVEEQIMNATFIGKK